MITAIYAGSFDPLTLGHLDIIKRSKLLCDKLVVAIGINAAKKNLLSEQERLQHLQKSIDQEFDFLTGINVKTAVFQGLLVEFAREQGSRLLVRGIRSAADFEYEMTLASVNRSLAPEIETVFLPTKPELAVISSSMVKEIARNNGQFQQFVPEHVALALQNKLNPA
jgi:pantetheine-phosphate adenylyltransferase